MDWIWIPITLGAAAAQTLRNAAQRSLVGELGSLGATLVRFLYGLPFAALYVAGLAGAGFTLPAPRLDYLVWVLLGALAQIAATDLLLRAMAARNFAVGIALSKTEILLAALFGVAVLADPLTGPLAGAVLLATLGVVLISLPRRGGLGALAAAGLDGRAALFGLGSGASFALAAVGYGAAGRMLASGSPAMDAACTLLWAQFFQTLLLGGWLVHRDPGIAGKTLRLWRRSLLAGLMGWAASAGWFTAFILAPIAAVRTLGMSELFFAWIISWRLFREPPRGAEAVGAVLLVGGILLCLQAR